MTLWVWFNFLFLTEKALVARSCIHDWVGERSAGFCPPRYNFSGDTCASSLDSGLRYVCLRGLYVPPTKPKDTRAPASSLSWLCPYFFTCFSSLSAPSLLPAVVKFHSFIHVTRSQLDGRMQVRWDDPFGPIVLGATLVTALAALFLVQIQELGLL